MLSDLLKVTHGGVADPDLTAGLPRPQARAVCNNP